MPPISPQKRARWERQAAQKGAIVPEYFEVFPTKVNITCGKCRKQFVRNLIPKLNEPTFVCPDCNVKNWIPLRYRL